jgi:hypothetical protein
MSTLTSLCSPGLCGRNRSLSLRRIRRAAARLVVGACVVSLLVGCSDNPADTTAESQPTMAAAKPELDGTSLPPWPAPTDVALRVASAGLDLGPMGTAEHYHPHLRIIIKGAEVPVAANIGVDPTTGAMSALHTHEPDGTIHIEADRVGEVFTLGQLFIQWGVKLTPTQIDGVKAENGREVVVRSNGEPVAGDPMNLRLEPDQRIVLELP